MQNSVYSVVRQLYVNDDARLQRLQLTPPTFMTLPSLDGHVTLQVPKYMYVCVCI